MDNIHIWIDWKIQASYEEDTRMPIAWYLFIDENGSSFATISDMTPVKKKKKKKTLIITSERKSSLDDIYASHRNKYRYPSFPLIIIYYNQE